MFFLGPSSLYTVTPSTHREVTSSGDMKGNRRAPAPSLWPSGAPVSSLSPSSPCPQGMGKCQVSQPATGSALLPWDTRLSCECGGPPHLPWQWAGGCPHSPPPLSCALLHQVASMVNLTLFSSPGPGPLLNMGPGTLYLPLPSQRA